MDSTRSVRHGQIEVGIIEHNGFEYAALGATVVRRRAGLDVQIAEGQVHRRLCQ
jgi:hypothetical protein